LNTLNIGKQTIKILTADDHSVIRHGLRQIISEEDDMEICGEAENGEQVFELLKQNIVDLLILDIYMPGVGGMDVLDKLKTSNSELPVLVLSVLPEIHYAAKVIKAGAFGFLNKIVASERLITAIRKISSKEYYLSPEMTAQLVSYLKENRISIFNNILSHLEFEIMCMIISGMTMAEISGSLNLSLQVVKVLHTRILEILGFNNNPELIQNCILNYLPHDFSHNKM
jgi:two-component system, NarL family, invasion response regulator UvrY